MRFWKAGFVSLVIINFKINFKTLNKQNKNYIKMQIKICLKN